MYSLSQISHCFPTVVIGSNGTLIEYIGDAILAVWNAPRDIDNHACLAICSTLLMQDKLQSLQEEWRNTVYKKRLAEGKKVMNFAVRCGLHTADCSVGNMGSPARMKYGVVGGTFVQRRRA